MRILTLSIVLVFSALGLAIAGEARLAIKGYDPVAYFTEGKPMLGDEKFEQIWDGARYRFVSASHLDAFKSNPDRYAPQFGGHCTAALAKGMRFEADPQNWTIAEGRLFLFGAPSGPAWFNQNPAAGEAQASAHWAPKRTGS